MDSLFPQFPVFLDLAGRAVVLLGDEPALLDLAQTCLTAGASVSVIATAPSAALRALSPPIRLRVRRWRASDLKGASLVVAGARAPFAARARIAAHVAGALFHALDAPGLCDVALGGVAARGAVSIGVSAQGAPEAVVHAVRDRLEAALPVGLSDFLAAAASHHVAVLNAFPDAEARAAFWSRLAAEAFEQKLTDAEAWNQFVATRLSALI